jgi:hypothetical protein
MSPVIAVFGDSHLHFFNPRGYEKIGREGKMVLMKHMQR